MTGPAAIASCPSHDELACFQRGETPSSRIEELAEHLETCSGCQSSLASLSFAADDLLDELRRVRDLDRPDEVSLIDEMAALESDSGTIFGDTQKLRMTVHA